MTCQIKLIFKILFICITFASLKYLWDLQKTDEKESVPHPKWLCTYMFAHRNVLWTVEQSVAEKKKPRETQAPKFLQRKKNIKTSGKSTQGPPYRTERLTNNCTNCEESRSEAADAKTCTIGWVRSVHFTHCIIAHNNTRTKQRSTYQV